MEIDTIRSIFHLAIKWGYAKDNPVNGITMLKEDDHKKPRFLSRGKKGTAPFICTNAIKSIRKRIYLTAF